MKALAMGMPARDASGRLESNPGAQGAAEVAAGIFKPLKMTEIDAPPYANRSELSVSM